MKPHSKKIIWLGLSLVLLINNSYLKVGQAQTLPPVLINELAWAGSSSSSNDEWIELKNTTSEDIDLTGWQITKDSSGSGTGEALMIDITTNPDPLVNIIPANGYFLIANNDKDYDFGGGKLSVLNIAPNLIDSSMTLSNEKLSIKLYQGIWNDGGVLQDKAGDGLIPLAGSNSAKTSMERNEQFGEGDLAPSWHEATSATNLDDGVIDKATPLSINSIPLLPRPVVTSVQPNQAEIDTIFEIESISGENFIPDNNTQALLQKNTLTILATDVHVANPTLIDAAKFDLHDAETGAWDLVIINPDQQTGILPNAVTLTETEAEPTYSGDIIINELYPNPATTSNDEFIELYNSGISTVNLKSWKLDDQSPGGSAEYVISSDIVIMPKQYLSFTKAVTHISLNDTGDSARLIQPNGTILSQTPNYGSASKGSSYSWINNSWQWSLRVTKDQPNILELPENEDDNLNDIINPPITIKLNYEEAVNHTILLTWEINYPSRLDSLNIYQSEAEEKLGELVINLPNSTKDYLVKDSAIGAKYFFTLTGISDGKTITSNQLEINLTNVSTSGEFGQIRITEILPNPSEGEEFIELHNPGEKPIDISGWKLVDASRKSYVINVLDLPAVEPTAENSNRVIIQPDKYVMLGQITTGIRLNNSGGEELSLLDGNGNLIDAVAYTTSAKKGEAYVLAPNDSWFWSDELTPGEANDISFAGTTGDATQYLTSSGPNDAKYLLELILFGIMLLCYKYGKKLSYN